MRGPHQDENFCSVGPSEFLFPTANLNFCLLIASRYARTSGLGAYTPRRSNQHASSKGAVDGFYRFPYIFILKKISVDGGNEPAFCSGVFFAPPT